MPKILLFPVICREHHEALDERGLCATCLLEEQLSERRERSIAEIMNAA